MQRATPIRPSRRSFLAVVAVATLVVPPLALASRRAEPSRPPGLLNPVTVQVQGTRVAPNVCRYDFGLALAPGEDAVGQDVVSVDDATCSLVVQQGVPADVVDLPAPAEKHVAATPAAPASPKRALARAAAVHSAGYFKSYYEDPVGIDVNSVRNNVDWYWNYSYVFGGSCSASYGWYSPSGWSLKENNFFCRYENYQTRVRSSSYAHFHNGIFCFTIDTDTYYNRNNAAGYYDGYLRGWVSATKSGGCTGLLSFHTRLVRTLN